MSCVSVSVDMWGMNVDMEFSDDDDFPLDLTQNSSRNYGDTDSAAFGKDVISEGNSRIVSLECNDEPVFELESNVLDSTQAGVCDGIDIEDISDDKAIDKM